jgi:hypothetical protein
MEKLATNLTSEVFGVEDGFGTQHFFLCPAESLQSLTRKIAPISKHFALFLAIDGCSLHSESVGEAARELIEKGLASLCVWGADCERIHDIFDETGVELDLDQNRAVIMTTWHDAEPLEEAIWYFMNCAIPDEAYRRTCKDWIFAPIGNLDWASTIRAQVAARGKERPEN